jgi:hypothetical protein
MLSIAPGWCERMVARLVLFYGKWYVWDVRLAWFREEYSIKAAVPKGRLIIVGYITSLPPYVAGFFDLGH